MSETNEDFARVAFEERVRQNLEDENYTVLWDLAGKEMGLIRNWKLVELAENYPEVELLIDLLMQNIDELPAIYKET